MDTRKSGLSFGRRIVEEAPLDLSPGEPLVMRVFTDRSVVEVFANDRQAIARMVYPTKGGTGVALFSRGGGMKTTSVKVWEMMPSNPY
jgi:beta-fructofuranosidase